MKMGRACAAGAAILTLAAGVVAAREADSGDVREGEWGSFKGRFVLDRDPPEPKPVEVRIVRDCQGLDLVEETLAVRRIGRGVKNVLVFLHAKAPPIHTDYADRKEKEALLEQVGRRFEPRILPMTVEQALVVRNGDQVAHNVRAAPAESHGFNRMLQGGQSFKHRFEEVERLPVQFVCDVHPWMRAYVLPCAHPYFAVTDADGRFEIKNLPAGFREFRVWHEAAGWLTLEPPRPDGVRPTLKANIPDGETFDLGAVEVSLDQFTQR